MASIGYEKTGKRWRVFWHVTLQQAWEKYPDAAPRIISGNGPQFIAGDFKEFIRLSGMCIRVKTTIQSLPMP